MRPSSFVFVAIVGLWAAHLLPQWIRRRDALGASRGDDRHSSALRVLARRHRRRAPGRSSVPLLPSIPVVSAPPVVEAPAPGPASLLVEPRTPSVGPAARRRRSVFGALAGLAFVSVAGAVLGAVPPALAVVSTLLLVLDVAALRAVAVAEHRRRAARAERIRRAELRAERAARAAARTAPVAAPVPAQQPEVAAGTPDAARPAAVLAAAEAPAVDDRTWVPVPVPPPTYTLKPVAPRPMPAPLERELDPAASTVPAPALAAVRDVPATEPAAEVDLDSVLERRRAVNG
jgi:hypothetical protein